jgi:hypothetical protein
LVIKHAAQAFLIYSLVSHDLATLVFKRERLDGWSGTYGQNELLRA